MQGIWQKIAAFFLSLVSLLTPWRVPAAEADGGKGAAHGTRAEGRRSVTRRGKTAPPPKKNSSQKIFKKTLDFLLAV